MALYTTDGDMYAAWKPVGRWFALIAVVALLFAATGFAIIHGFLPIHLALYNQLFVFIGECIAGGLGILMAMAAFGSIALTYSQRGEVEVTEIGVRRIFSRDHEEFFPRQQIAGFDPRSTRGIVLIDNTGKQMLIPRTIYDYRDCVAEIRAMGIAPLPADQLPRKIFSGHRLTRGEKIYGFFVSFLGNLFFNHKDQTPLAHRITGFVFLVAALLGIAWMQRKYGKYSQAELWINVSSAIAVIAVLIWRW